MRDHPRHRLIVATDGRAGTRAAFERDGARDARLTAAGYRVVRFTYRQVLYEPDFVSELLGSLLGSDQSRQRRADVAGQVE